MNPSRDNRVGAKYALARAKARLRRPPGNLRLNCKKHSIRENRRRLQSPKRSWYVGSFLLIATLGALDIGWSVLVSYAVHHPYFIVSDIIIDADGGFSEQEVQTWSGLAAGMSLWEIDPPQVEARLLTYPWIRTAEVKREFPQRVYVTLKARRAVAIVLQPSLTYLDDTGVCFTSQEDIGILGLPFISGLETLAPDGSTARAALAGVLHLLSLTRLWQEPLSEIHWDQQQGYTLFLARRRVTIRLGWETVPEKVAQVGVALQSWPMDGPAALFDARFADQVVVRPYTDERTQGKKGFAGSL